MKAHRTDCRLAGLRPGLPGAGRAGGCSPSCSALDLPPVGWFLAGGLILIGAARPARRAALRPGERDAGRRHRRSPDPSGSRTTAAEAADGRRRGLSAAQDGPGRGRAPRRAGRRCANAGPARRICWPVESSASAGRHWPRPRRAAARGRIAGPFCGRPDRVAVAVPPRFRLYLVRSQSDMTQSPAVRTSGRPGPVRDRRARRPDPRRRARPAARTRRPACWSARPPELRGARRRDRRAAARRLADRGRRPRRPTPPRCASTSTAQGRWVADRVRVVESLADGRRRPTW